MRIRQAHALTSRNAKSPAQENLAYFRIACRRATRSRSQIQAERSNRRVRPTLARRSVLARRIREGAGQGALRGTVDADDALPGGAAAGAC